MSSNEICASRKSGDGTAAGVWTRTGGTGEGGLADGPAPVGAVVGAVAATGCRGCTGTAMPRARC